jgi:hypothetical protein
MLKYQGIVSQFFPTSVMEEGVCDLVAWSGTEVNHVQEVDKEVKIFEIDESLNMQRPVKAKSLVRVGR